MTAPALVPRDSGQGILWSGQFLGRKEEFADDIPNLAAALGTIGVSHFEHGEVRVQALRRRSAISQTPA
jgi:hypothetical protein